MSEDTSMRDAPRAPGVLVGAYERDNFGDILFLTHTRRYLGEIAAHAAAPFAADMRGYGGEEVVSYPSLLEGERCGFLWTVGGEAGATSVSEAVAMATGEVPASLETASRIAGVPAFASPYIPRPSRYASTAAAPSIINSVGLSGAAHLTGRHRVETWNALRESSFLSVRDRASSTFLDRIGVSHVVAPDLVQTAAFVRPDVDTRADLALVQSKEKHLKRLGIPAVARLLVDSKSLAAFHIRLFSAGGARGHDSTPLLHDLSAEINRLAGADRSSVSVAVTADEKVAEIAGAGLWVGTSLHGFILSTAFGVPRVATLIDKMTTYADAWQIPFPTAVQLDDLDDAVESALRSARTVDPARKAEELASAAEANVLAAVEVAAGGPVARRDAARATRELEQMTPVRASLEHYSRLGRAAVRRIKRTVR